MAPTRPFVMDHMIEMPPDYEPPKLTGRQALIALAIMVGLFWLIFWFVAQASADEIGKKTEQSLLCSDAKSAAIAGQTLDDEPDLFVEILRDLVRKHLCVFLPGTLKPEVTLQKKITHVAATDVWQVGWDNETWYIIIDAPRDSQL